MTDTLLLVGNGPSLIGSNLGNKIDSFDNVVRFNNFCLDKYTVDVGTKTTILARRSCDDVKWHDPSLFQSVWNFVTYCQWTPGMAAFSRQVDQFYGDKSITIGSSVCKTIGEDIKLNQPYQEWASIGVLAIGYAVSTFLDKTIYICGFDHLKPDDKGVIHHYFPKKPKDAKYHNGLKERQYVDALILSNRVKRL